MSHKLLMLIITTFLTAYASGSQAPNQREGDITDAKENLVCIMANSV